MLVERSFKLGEKPHVISNRHATARWTACREAAWTWRRKS
jgi:hypothetical protein